MENRKPVTEIPFELKHLDGCFRTCEESLKARREKRYTREEAIARTSAMVEKGEGKKGIRIKGDSTEEKCENLNKEFKRQYISLFLNEKDSFDCYGVLCEIEKLGINYLAKDSLNKGSLYLCRARNFCIARWNGKSFTYTHYTAWEPEGYEDSELHWDEEDYGTVKPYIELGDKFDEC